MTDYCYPTSKPRYSLTAEVIDRALALVAGITYGASILSLVAWAIAFYAQTLALTIGGAR